MAANDSRAFSLSHFEALTPRRSRGTLAQFHFESVGGRSMRSQKLIVCSLAFALAVFAQSDRGTITGTIADPAGAVVASAAIEVRNVETGAVYQVGSSATGNYVVQVPAGTYEVTVNVAGFKKYVRQGIAVPVAQTLRIDVNLEVGSNAESVTVTEAA